MPHPVRDFRRRRRVDVRPDALWQDNAVGATLFRAQSYQNLSTITSGKLYLCAVGLVAGRKISSIAFSSGSVALTHGSGNNSAWWFALYGPTLALLGQTANQGQTAWGTYTVKDLALATPAVIPVSGCYYAGVMVYPGTGGSPAVPNFWGVAPGQNLTPRTPILCGDSTSGLTGGTAPAQADAITYGSYLPWCQLR